ncbi:PorP/SprF family type IX secretion system membrane protein [Snuella sedimenti]|uniref:PorP/SprF family type IX secretion system membrane protein n=1 Tax=Snuella sedimenti TaxID=2798802 RepID=A0A8J7IHH2_9FLAO|nr:PorP/SprF family type IX secretion system membrane protein [Snuella sedimenti]MBJ6368448.1 PorP/SprF family type IX secretion system membrane protein [Snuella sedimenti]
MKIYLLHIIILLCLTQHFYAQEDGVVALSLPVRNALKFNRYIINPSFSFVREQNKYLSFYNKKQWAQFDDAPQTYLFSYAGRFKERIGAGIGLFQQNHGVLNTYGGILNFAYNASLNRDSNLTFGVNLGFYQSGINRGKIITNFPDSSLDNIPSNTLVTINPGINYGTAFFDFGVSVNNLVSYNFKTSKLIEDNPEQSIQGHIMYTGYMNARGFFDESKFSFLARSEFKTNKTVLSGVAMLSIPKGLWGQAGYNSLYGLSAGIGINISSQIALEYNYEQAVGDLSTFGNSHEITLAYKFKNKTRYNYNGDDDEQALFTPSRKSRRVIAKPKKTTNTKTDRQSLVEARKKEKAEAVKQLKEKAAAKAATRTKQKAEAEARIAAKSNTIEKEQEAKLVAETKVKQEDATKAKALEKAKIAAEIKAKQEEAARIKREELAKAKAIEDAKIAAENKAKEKAAIIKRDELAKAKALEEARIAAETKAKQEEAARIKREELAKAKALENARIAAENKAKEEALAKTKAAEEEEEEEKVASENKVDDEFVIPVSTDANTDAMSKITQLARDSKLIQQELMAKLGETIASKEQDLKDLKEENDLSEQGVYVAPKPFKSVTAENRALEALTSEIDVVIKSQEEKITTLENLYSERLKKVRSKNDATNIFYSNAIQDLKKEQSRIKQAKESLITELESIKVATEIERKRRIKRASYDNQEVKYMKDMAALNQIKQNTPLSTVPLTVEDFDFGEDLGTNIKILTNVKNTESGYYLVIAVHSDVVKRDDFLTKSVAAGQSDINFFFDVKTSKYYIYHEKFSSLEAANQALQLKGSKPYNGKMSMVKIEN